MQTEIRIAKQCKESGVTSICDLRDAVMELRNAYRGYPILDAFGRGQILETNTATYTLVK